MQNYYHAIGPDPDITNVYSKLILLPQPAATDQVLCHLDLTYDNLIKSADGIFALDWEYAHYCDPVFDLAVFVTTSELSNAQIALLLDNYDRREPDLEQRLHNFGLLYSMIEILWWHNRGKKLFDKMEALTRALSS